MTIYWSNVIRTSGIARTKIYHFVQDIFDKLLCYSDNLHYQNTNTN